MTRCLSLAALLITSTLALAAEPTLSVGFAEADVTPAVDGKTPVYLAGFGPGRAATKVHDPLFARAVVLSDGTKKVALVAVDVVGLFLPTVEQVRAKLTGYEYVLVSATHNHEGPDTMGIWGRSPVESGVDAKYQKALVEKIAGAVTAAEKKLAPAVARVGTADAPELLHDGREPFVKHDRLVVVRFDPATGDKAKPLGILVQWNCHPETLSDKNTEVSADFIGYTVKHVSAKYDCPVAYFNGTVGGLMTSLHVPIKDAKGEELKDGTFEKTEAYGVAVGRLAEKAEAAAVPATLVPFTARTAAVLVPVTNGLYRAAWQIGVLDRPLYAWENDPTPKAFTPLKQLKDAKQLVAVKSEVGYLKLGELEVAAIPGEIYPELTLGKVQTPADKAADFPDAPTEPAIYDQLQAKHKMIVGLANDELGYIVPKRQWDEQPPFCYGRKKAQYGEGNSCGPDMAPVLCETFKKLAAGK